MNDLVEWLRAQLDQDEVVASAEVFPHRIKRGLAEVAAKRQLIDGHDPDWPRLECPTCCGYDGNDNYGVERRPREAYPCRVVRLLALPYADRPGYRDEWRPDAPA